MDTSKRKIILNKIKNSGDKRVSKQLLRDVFKDNMFITGSYLWGLNNKESDIDLCGMSPVSIEHYTKTAFDILLNNGAVYLGDYSEKLDEGYQSVYALPKSGRLLNILIFHDEKEFKIWKGATEVMSIFVKSLMKSNSSYKFLMDNKKYRVALFEEFKGLLRHNLYGGGELCD